MYTNQSVVGMNKLAHTRKQEVKIIGETIVIFPYKECKYRSDHVHIDYGGGLLLEVP